MKDAAPISIWRPREENGELVFTRPEPHPFGDHYAERRSISAVKPDGCRRICFFGESAAAGYLYAPHLTPAKVLSDQLAAALDRVLFEVVDLARTNETLDSLVETVAQALQLQPDLLVIFTGNNWNLLETPAVSPYYPSAAGRRAYAAAWRQAGVMGPIELAARQRLEKAGRALAQIDALARPAGIPVILVIPEVNLADWETRQPVVWLPGDGTPRWHALYRQTAAALEQRDWPTALRLANQMLDLDGGSCASTFRLLARVQEGLGSLKRARLAAEAEISSSNYATIGFLSAPQAAVMDQEVQRRAGAVYGFKVVDLPAVFGRYTGSVWPGQRLFLDYCHLTAEGMKVAMAAVTAAVLDLSGDDLTDISWPDLLDRLPDPGVPDAIEAATRFGAAIHTAHRLLPVGSSDEILRYWLRMALAADPGVESAMLDLVAVRAAPAPAVLTAAQQANLGSPYPLQFQHGWRYCYLDWALLKAIGDVLAERGSRARETIPQLLEAGRGANRAGLELVFPPAYLWEPLARFYPETMSYADLTERAALRSPWPVIHLGFVSGAAAAMVLSLSARLPGLGNRFQRRRGFLGVMVNGHRIQRLNLTDRWTNHTLKLPQPMLRPGINRLTLAWPSLPPAGTEALDAALSRLEQGLEADIHPVFGELFSAKVAPAR